MDITTYLTASEIRARIFICQAKIHELKQKRKKCHQNIRGAKKLIKNIERCIDKKLDSELCNFEVSSVATCLKFLRETLCDLDYFWQKEVEYCIKLHRKMDELGEMVYP
jgi:hypothetical protein